MKYLASFFLLFISVNSALASIIHVDKNSTASNPNGSNWIDSFSTLHEAIEAATFGDEIWLTGGVYGSLVDGEWNAQFDYGISYFGGFEGWETSINERTFLSSGTTINGGSAEGHNEKMLWMLNGTATHIDHIDFFNYELEAGSTSSSFIIGNSDLTFNGCRFTNIDASDSGTSYFSYATFEDFSDGIIQFNSCEFDQCNFGSFTTPSGNVENNIRFLDCSFYNSESTYNWGPIFRFIDFTNCSFTFLDTPTFANACNFTNCLFTQCDWNLDSLNDEVFRSSSIYNCTISLCSANGRLFGLYNEVINSIVWDIDFIPSELYSNTSAIHHSILPELTSYVGEENLIVDPLFNGNEDFTLSNCSAALNSGDPNVTSFPYDIEGNDRIIDVIDRGCFESTDQSSARIYVDLNATGNQDGTSWTHAFTSLQAALSSSCELSEIWISEGTYFPDDSPNSPDRELSFEVTSGLKIYGGFVGYESELSQRNLNSVSTVLSGEIGESSNADNSYTIMKIDIPLVNVVLDGLHFIGGNSNGLELDQTIGGALEIHFGDVSITNCNFENNVASSGGSISIRGNEPARIENCNFQNNEANENGGAITLKSVAGLSPSPWISRCTFIDNKAQFGGALDLEVGETFIDNCQFIEATSEAGAFFIQDEASAYVYNCTIAKNELSIINLGQLFIYNSIIFFNEESILNEGNVVANHCIIENGFDGDYVLDLDPEFTNLDQNDYSFGVGSPAFNNGNNDFVVGTVDLIGNPRFQLGQIDMGSYEFGQCANDANFCIDAESFDASSTSDISDQLDCDAASQFVPFECGIQGRSKWYQFEMIDQSILFELEDDTSGDIDLAMEIFTGSCDNPVLISCVDENGFGGLETLSLEGSGLEVGQTIYIRISGLVQGVGTEFNLTLEHVACSIESVNSTPVSLCYENGENFVYDHMVTVFYSYPPTEGGIIINGQLYPLVGSPQAIVLEGLIADGGNIDLEIEFESTAGGFCSYFLEDGITKLCCDSGGNSNCEGALEIPLATSIFSNACASFDADDPISQCVDESASHTLWHKISAPQSALHLEHGLINNSNGVYDPNLTVFVGNCSSLELHECMNDSAPNFDENITIEPSNGVYYIMTRSTFNNSSEVYFNLENASSGPFCLGDFDGSGIVDASDLLVFLSSWGCISDCSTDLTGDDIVNSPDLLLFLSQFGEACD